MIMGADYYESDKQQADLRAAGRVPIGIGADSTISNTIVDKNARIGENCNIVNADGIEEANREDEGFYIRSGIVTVRYCDVRVPFGFFIWVPTLETKHSVFVHVLVNTGGN